MLACRPLLWLLWILWWTHKSTITSLLWRTAIKPEVKNQVNGVALGVKLFNRVVFESFLTWCQSVLSPSQSKEITVTFNIIKIHWNTSVLNVVSPVRTESINSYTIFIYIGRCGLKPFMPHLFYLQFIPVSKLLHWACNLATVKTTDVKTFLLAFTAGKWEGFAGFNTSICLGEHKAADNDDLCSK